MIHLVEGSQYYLKYNYMIIYTYIYIQHIYTTYTTLYYIQHYLLTKPLSVTCLLKLPLSCQDQVLKQEHKLKLMKS